MLNRLYSASSIGLNPRSGNKAQQLGYARLDKMNAGGLKRLKEAARESQGDYIAVP